MGASQNSAVLGVFPLHARITCAHDSAGVDGELPTKQNWLSEGVGVIVAVMDELGVLVAVPDELGVLVAVPDELGVEDQVPDAVAVVDALAPGLSEEVGVCEDRARASRACRAVSSHVRPSTSACSKVTVWPA